MSQGGVNWPILIGGLLGTATLIAVLGSGFGKDPRAMEGSLSEAVNFSLPTLEGDELTLSDLRGQPVVLNFWSTWCQPCKIEHPYVLQAARAHHEQGAVFIGVLYDDEPAKARRELQRIGQAFPTVYDPSQRVSVDYGVTGVPETFIIDAEGRIAEKFVGPVGPGQIEQALKELL